MAGISKGVIGETIAARFLRDKKYIILAANYRCRFGEIDIIAADRSYIAFVEVKTRRADALYTPREAVTIAKQRRIMQTASMYLSHNPIERQPRFDVIEVVTATDDPMNVVELNHIIDAYEAGDLHTAF